MKIGELSQSCGLSIDTLRYYERIGLIKSPLRDSSGHRVYPNDVLAWIDFLKQLKSTGMPISKMRRYAALREEGAVSREERAQILCNHREFVQSELARLNEHVKILDEKITHYKDTNEICPADLRVQEAKEKENA